MRTRNVLFVNALSALATAVTALTIFLLGDLTSLNPAPLLAIAVGFFIYIAASDIIPDIHNKSRSEENVQAAILLLGVLLVGLIISLAPHDHEGSSARPAETDEHSKHVEPHQHTL